MTPTLLRRLLPILLAALLLGTTVPAVAAADLTQSQAEYELAKRLNALRADLGLRALRIDTRLVNLGRYRSRDMASKNYFSHEHSDGRYAWDIMTDWDIDWFWAGEVLSMSGYKTRLESVEAAARGWRNSSTHWAIVKDPDYNYFGMGYAWDSDRGAHIWTGVFLKGPDRTGGWARMDDEGVRLSSYGGSARRVSISWEGNDILLSVLTAGFRNFEVGRRVDDDGWRYFIRSTTSKWWSGDLARGHRYQFRVRVIDRVGNRGRWSSPIAINT